MIVPILIGSVLKNYCVVTTIENGVAVNVYEYTLPMSIFAGICSLAIIVSLLLKRIDKKMGYGLQLPNIKK
ncbi:MAG: hypothetical protein A2X17_01950 [Bacteroidetes bacterium GWF2_41_61]|nr:MAG: hypothetical protein A2X17_01950 [Bacteroidetes bacterium GWF2_41_61]